MEGGGSRRTSGGSGPRPGMEELSPFLLQLPRTRTRAQDSLAPIAAPIPWGGGAVCVEGKGTVFLLDARSDMEFLEVLTEHLDRVMLVRGGGREVITIYS